MYCKCKDKKSVESMAAGKTFKVCSKNKGGCGHEISANMKAKATTFDFISAITEETLMGEQLTECPACSGWGLITDVSFGILPCNFCNANGAT